MLQSKVILYYMIPEYPGTITIKYQLQYYSIKLHYYYMIPEYPGIVTIKYQLLLPTPSSHCNRFEETESLVLLIISLI